MFFRKFACDLGFAAYQQPTTSNQQPTTNNQQPTTTFLDLNRSADIADQVGYEYDTRSF